MSREAKPKKAPARGYHHKDLRRALMDAALLHLAEHDITRLNMQLLARAAGVSAGAPYHHFADKEAVIAALAAEGFDLLYARLREAAEQGTGVPGSEPAQERTMARLAELYLDFAAAHDAHYRLMFLPELEDRVRFAEVHQASGRVLALLLQVLRAGLASATPKLIMARAMVALAMMHGFASLRSARVLSNIPGAPSLAAQKTELIERLGLVVFANPRGAAIP